MTINTNNQQQKKSIFRFIWVLPILLMVVAAIPKILGLEFMVENAAAAGLGHMLFAIGIIELFCVAVFLVPKTRRIGFFLCTAFIGGIITARWMDQAFNAGVIMQILLWVGMYFEDKELFAIGLSNT